MVKPILIGYNWVRLNKEYVDKLVWIIDYLAISIDWVEKTHNDFRWNSKSYAKGMDAFKNLVNAWINTEILMTINKRNIWDIEDLYNEIWRDNTKIYLKIMHMADKMPDFLKEICLNKEEIKKLKRKAENMWIGIQAPVAEFNNEWNSSFFGCPWWIITWIIDTSWDVHKCLYIRDEGEKLWNVFEKKLREIWFDTEKKISESLWKTCRNCSHKSVCGGFCTLCKTENRYITENDEINILNEDVTLKE